MICDPLGHVATLSVRLRKTGPRLGIDFEDHATRHVIDFFNSVPNRGGGRGVLLIFDQPIVGQPVPPDDARKFALQSLLLIRRQRIGAEGKISAHWSGPLTVALASMSAVEATRSTDLGSIRPVVLSP